MDSRRQRDEKDSGGKPGVTTGPGGNRDNSLERLAEVHRGGRTKGEHLGAKGHEERKDFEMGVGRVQLQSKKQQLQTHVRADTGRNAAGGGDRSADDLEE